MSFLDLWNVLSAWAYQCVPASTIKQADKSTFCCYVFPCAAEIAVDVAEVI